MAGPSSILQTGEKSHNGSKLFSGPDGMVDTDVMEESQLWKALSSGDIQALKSLYDRYAGLLFSYGMSLCKDENRVHDAIHDLFLSFWNHRQSLTIPTHGKAYLMVSLRRRIFDKGTKLEQMTGTLEGTHTKVSGSDDPETDWIRSEDDGLLREQLQTAMATLSDRQREIIHMKYFQQMDYEEIARVMDLNYQSARNLVNRALMALRRAMVILAALMMSGM